VPEPHPVHALETRLQAARLEAVERLAAREGAFTAEALHELATLQAALTAVREEIVAHTGKMGWGSGAELD
jgi:hypothetical protein